MTLDIQHTRVEDLEVVLEAPDGTMVELFSDVGGDGDNLVSTTLDDDVSELVSNIMGKRYGDADLDQDVDINDAIRLVVHSDPLGVNGFASWRNGNFDGDSDIDLSDFNTLFMNSSPLGYPVGMHPSVVEFDSVPAGATPFAQAVVHPTSRTVAASAPTNVSVALQPSDELVRPRANASSQSEMAHGGHRTIVWREAFTARRRRLMGLLRLDD